MREEEITLCTNEIKALKKFTWQFEKKLSKAKNEEDYNKEVQFINTLLCELNLDEILYPVDKNLVGSA
jgi:hypothetical protein